MKFYTKILLTSMFALVLAACSSTSDMDNEGMDDASGSDVAEVVLNPNAGRPAIDTSMPQAGQKLIGGSSVANGGAIVAEGDAVLYFEFDQSTLTADSRAALMRIAAALRNSTGSLRLEGHADERGTREYNIALGERRAKSVADFLVLQGVAASRLETISYGEERPAMMGSNENSWSKNRRVEIK